MDLVQSILYRVRSDIEDVDIDKIYYIGNHIHIHIPSYRGCVQSHNDLYYSTSYDTDSMTYAISLHLLDYDKAMAVILMVSHLL